MCRYHDRNRPRGREEESENVKIRLLSIDRTILKYNTKKIVEGTIFFLAEGGGDVVVLMRVKDRPGFGSERNPDIQTEPGSYLFFLIYDLLAYTDSDPPKS